MDSIDKEFLEGNAKHVLQSNAFNEEAYDRYNVKRGLRNRDGSGVLVGLTEIGDVLTAILAICGHTCFAGHAAGIPACPGRAALRHGRIGSTKRIALLSQPVHGRGADISIPEGRHGLPVHLVHMDEQNVGLFLLLGHVRA